jgi:VWFA-related protein
MHKFLRPFLAALCLSSAALAQQPPTPGAPTTVLQTGTQLVVLDVVVQDKSGNPIKDLTRDDFHITENKAPQQLRNFDEHTDTDHPVPGPQLPPLPPGTFTDYTPVPPNGTLNILLLDALNTPMTDQSYVRYELQQYVKHAPPGTRIAIFGLASRLILLQGFTSDPQTLKDVVDHKLIPRSSNLLDDPTGTNSDHQNLSDLAGTSQSSGPPSLANTNPATLLAANLQQFEAETAAMQTQLRLQYTLDAFNSLGHYLAAFPGRKNLIWFSGSFPLNILPDPSLANPFTIQQLNQEEFRETSNLLSKAQVAVYPVDARGLMPPPMFSAANSGRSFAGNPQKFNSALNKFSNNQAAEHTTMNVLATDTGGQAFYNTNDLADAVAKAINAGSNYYTLAYSPTNRKQDGGYREIRVTLSASAAARGLQLAYRHGYYADDAAHTPETATTAAPTTDAYARAAMSRGAPQPQDLLFKVRVLPASTTTETAAVPSNTLDPSVSPKGPFRRYDVDIVALPSELTLTPQPNGLRSGKVEFLVFVFDLDGRLLTSDGKAISLNLTPETYTRTTHSALNTHLEISVPTRQDTFLRIGVHDIPSNHFGVVEIPTSEVSHLPPPIYPAAPAPTPSTSTPAAPIPSTQPTAPTPQARPPQD